MIFTSKKLNNNNIKTTPHINLKSNLVLIYFLNIYKPTKYYSFDLIIKYTVKINYFVKYTSDFMVPI